MLHAYIVNVKKLIGMFKFEQFLNEALCDIGLFADNLMGHILYSAGT